MATESSQDTGSNTEICALCGLPAGTLGSMTTWILRDRRCQCSAPTVEKKKTTASEAVSLQEQFAPAQILDDRYQILEPLGRGGVGFVYKALDLETNQLKAIKLMHREIVENELATQRFSQEVAVAAELMHTNVVRLFGYARARDGQPYLVMELVDGENLEQLLAKNNGRLDPKRALNIFIQICDGLMRVHQRGVIHRDLKPSNIIIFSCEGQERVKIVDFDFAKAIVSNVDNSLRLTQTGEVFGSPFYMSPEQCLGQELEARSDIYSLGCLMYETLTGTPPFVGGNALATVAKQVREEAPSMRILHAEIPESLDNVVLRCLAKEPLLRYQSVCDLLSSLHKVKSGKSVSTPTIQAKRQPTNANSAKLSRFAQASPLEWAIAVGVILVLATILTAAIYMAKTAPSLVSPAVQNPPAGQIERLNAVENQPRQAQKNSTDERSGNLPNITKRAALTNPYVKTAPASNGWKQLRQLRVRI